MNINENNLKLLSQQILDEIEFDIDDRSSPDTRRLAQFKRGWQNATFKDYSSSILKKLTWNNLGYRFSKKLGNKSESEMKQFYDYLAKIYFNKNNSIDIQELNITSLERKIDNFLKLQRQYNKCLEILVDCIKHCHNCGSDKWSIYYKPDQYKIRLIAGRLIVLTIEKKGIWLTLDQEILEKNHDYQNYLEKIDTWTWDNHDYPIYSQVPSRNGYYNPSENYDYLEDWNIIKNFHFSFIKKACTKYTTINQKSKLNHQPEIIKHLCNCLKTFIPQPDYYLNNSFFSFPEELSDETEITNLYEGAKQRITVNRYERNNQARQKCIEYYGTSCYVCGFNFEKIFGEIGQGFIHVHHLKPLSDINKEYEVDPIKDLRPICPNCHAMIHRKNPPFTIEEIKNIL